MRLTVSPDQSNLFLIRLTIVTIVGQRRGGRKERHMYRDPELSPTKVR